MKKILIITIGIWCLAACAGQEDDVPRVLEVSAEIASQTTTRITEGNVTSSDYDKLAFDNTDEILIKKGNDAAVTYKKGANTWIPKEGETPITTKGNEAFTASYPTVFTGILEDQTSFAGFWKSKQLTSTGVLDGNKVTFSFTPAAAKISIVVSYDDTQSSVTASVKGSAIRGGTSGEETINLLQTSASVDKKRYSFAGIIAPGTYTKSAYTITLMAGTVGKSHTLQKELVMQAGYNYQYTFTSTNELILTGVTVKPFIDQPEENSGSAT